MRQLPQEEKQTPVKETAGLRDRDALFFLHRNDRG